MSHSQPFQAEVRQLLDIVVHALYSEKEVFLRELVSNASDALEKLKSKQLKNQQIADANLPLEISISCDAEAKTLTISDSGIGMSEAELIQNLGTIAHSGTRKFLEAAKQGGTKADLIGQFGVGFYAAFMVGSSIEVQSQSFDESESSCIWRSEGKDSYQIERCDKLPRGTKIIIKLKEDADEFANIERIRGIVRQYSNFVSFPIIIDNERINTQEALWLRNKNELDKQQYVDFYKYLAHSENEPISWLHFSADSPIAINSLLYIPDNNPEQFGWGRCEPRVGLYCRKVLIDDKPEGLLPEWLRFLVGVIDSEDLPLNISREMLQDDGLVRRLGEIMTKRSIAHFEKLSTSDPQAFEQFYAKFGRYLKEGIVTSFAHQQSLAKLLRFESSLQEAGKLVSLADYVSRKKENQKAIYVLAGSSRQSVENSPYLEAFKARGLEVLFLLEHGDEVVIDSLNKFDDLPIQFANSKDIELEELAESGTALDSEQQQQMSEWAAKALEQSVAKVSFSNRLVDVPVLAVAGDGALSPQMRQYLQAMGQSLPESKPELLLNPNNTLIAELSKLQGSQPELATLMLKQLESSALLSAGLLEEPSQLQNNLTQLLTAVLQQNASADKA